MVPSVLTDNHLSHFKRWRGGRAVDCTGLENRQTFTGLGGSNPSLSANYLKAVSYKYYLKTGLLIGLELVYYNTDKIFMKQPLVLK